MSAGLAFVLGLAAGLGLAAAAVGGLAAWGLTGPRGRGLLPPAPRVAPAKEAHPCG